MMFSLCANMMFGLAVFGNLLNTKGLHMIQESNNERIYIMIPRNILVTYIISFIAIGPFIFYFRLQQHNTKLYRKW